MELDTLSSYLQKTATFPNPEPDQCSPQTISYLFKVQFNNVLQSTPRATKWSPSLRFPL